MLFGNGPPQDRSMRTEQMSHVSEEEVAAVVRIRLIQRAAVGGKRPLLGSSPRRWDLTKLRLLFDWIMKCMRLEEVVGNWVICGEHLAVWPARGVPSASAFALALRVLRQMG